MTTTPIPRFGLILIGDELLNGRKQDAHLAAMIPRFEERGLALSWVRTIADEGDLITHTLTQTFACPDVVFSFGGIGATPDDLTRQCAAAALGVDLALHPEAEAEIRSRLGSRLNPLHLRMGEFPVGSRIIPNPSNGIPGFAIHRHHFVPGFPRMAWPMVEWVLDHDYADLQAPNRTVSQTLVLTNTSEGPLIPLMELLLSEYPDLRLACLPNADGRREVELSLKGDPAQVVAGMSRLRGLLSELTG
ncbi:competence/damage-inducible protein A [Marinobacter caseinilyticus]|uniref:competence/damage-inducible protein A n=1 Tax=Marinobacter caseinilyticus TaxID=2692195 RepID=UPI001407D0AC|nr:molybdopterin-binding protein [Marinobacter caseinilyticus]